MPSKSACITGQNVFHSEQCIQTTYVRICLCQLIFWHQFFANCWGICLYYLCTLSTNDPDFLRLFIILRQAQARTQTFEKGGAQLGAWWSCVTCNLCQGSKDMLPILGTQFGAEVNVTMSNFLISRGHFHKKMFCSVHHLVVNPHAEQCRKCVWNN